MESTFKKPKKRAKSKAEKVRIFRKWVEGMNKLEEPVKKILALAVMMVGLAGFAQAETIHIQTTGGFGALHQYHDADTDVEGLTVDLYVGTSVELIFSDQVNPVTNSFTSVYLGTYAGNGGVSTLQKCVFAVPGAPCVFNGETLTLVLHETYYHRAVNSGRAHYYITRWTLLDGTIVR